MATDDSSASVTRLIRAYQGGSDTAIGGLFEAYFERLVQLARARLRTTPGLDAYEEDVALRSFDSMCRRVRRADRPFEFADRDALWRLLAARTVSRAIDVVRRHKPGETPGDVDVAQILNREPTAAEAAEAADECRRLLDLLDEPELRRIALWKVEGHTHEEIAEMLGCVPRTIERKVHRIRFLWRDELERVDA